MPLSSYSKKGSFTTKPRRRLKRRVRLSTYLHWLKLPHNNVCYVHPFNEKFFVVRVYDPHYGDGRHAVIHERATRQKWIPSLTLGIWYVPLLQNACATAGL